MRELKMKLCVLMLPLVVSLRINANCPGSLRKAPITSGVGNATGPRLAEAAERDYFILRERLMAMQKQLEGAQEYIRTQCIP